MIKPTRHGTLMLCKLILACLVCFPPAQAKEGMDYSAFKAIPVTEGRIKPLDTYARQTLRRFSGSENLNGRPAIAWLARTMFNPTEAVGDRVFTVHNENLKKRLGLPANQNRFSYKTLQEPLEKSRARAIQLSKQPPETLTRDEQAFLNLHGKSDTYLQILSTLPTAKANGDIEKTQYWQTLKTAYVNGNNARWAELSGEFPLPSGVSPVRLKAELMYNNYKPFNWATALYAFSLVLLAVYAATTKPFLKFLAYAGTACGLVAHGLAIAARIYILQRPPVGNLYESVLFVAFVTAAVAFYTGWRRGCSALMLFCGILAASILLVLAPVILGNAGDLGILTAVLNTNFWLGTHVLIITAGYGLCILTAMLAHGYLALRLWKGPAYDSLPGFFKLLYRTSLAALLCMATGTVLGGIWADQSWGRFWGWDPKENGALLIVLWLIWAQHGRLSGHLGETAFAAAMAALNLIVGLAWFGVNLLNVGLHSYGFTSGLAGGLAVFSAVQILLITGLWAGIKKRSVNNV